MVEKIKNVSNEELLKAIADLTVAVESIQSILLDISRRV